MNTNVPTSSVATPARANVYHEAGNDRLDLFLAPGDVLCIQGQPGGIMRLGATGGYMGHVLLATSNPRPIHRGTAEASLYRGVWPDHHNARTLWQVSTIESTRAQEGFHECLYLLYVDDKTGRIMAIGEEHHDQYVRFEFPVKVEICQCPRALRKGFRPDIMNVVLDEMRQNEANWSWTTAVRAFLFSAQVHDGGRRTCVDTDSVLEDIQRCWTSDPICSSLIVVFWQRYLCELADFYNAHPSPHTTEVNALDWIMQWMPLKSDRALPGDVISAMEQCEWVFLPKLPQPQPQSARGRPRSSSDAMFQTTSQRKSFCV